MLEITAPAKVNLHLRVLGKRPDGYHEICTCLHALALADTLTLEEAGGEAVRLEQRLSVSTGFPVSAGPDNLVCRAAAAFFAATGIRGGAAFTLDKRIPAGAGLGGGSSDAAAALLLLNARFAVPLDAPRLHAVASGLGADVPFFLGGGTQIGRGRGDRLEPVARPPRLWLVLILPPFGTSTAAVYARCRAPRLPVSSSLGEPAELEDPARWVNDLEEPALEVEPRLGALRERVVAAGYPAVRMSGSGSTLFLAFHDRAPAERALAALTAVRATGAALLLTSSDPAPYGSRQPRSRGAGAGGGSPGHGDESPRAVSDGTRSCIGGG